MDPSEFPDEPLLEPVDPLGRTYRLNLRPAKRRGVDPLALAHFLLEQPRKGGDEGIFWEWWSGAVQLAEEGRIPFPPGKLKGYGRFLRETGIVPHHSRDYRKLNKPHYRLVNDLEDPEVRGILRALGLWG